MEKFLLALLAFAALIGAVLIANTHPAAAAGEACDVTVVDGDIVIDCEIGF